MPDFEPRRDRSCQHRRDPRFVAKVLHIEMSDNLLTEVRDIARERQVSLYRQLREFIVQGVREYNKDKRIAERDEDAPKDIFDGKEWQP